MKRILIFLILIISIPTVSLALQDEYMSSQKETINIGSFVKEAKEYTKEAFPDMDINSILNSAIKGDLDNKSIIKNVFNLFGNKLMKNIKNIGIIIAIIILNSILKSISDNLQNNTVSKVTDYVQYILIVTLILHNFSDIINLTKDTIQNLTGFINLLIPILISLMITTGNIVSAGIIEPFILFCITFIGNIIQMFILPLLLVSTALGIVSNISDRIQINKLSKYFNSSIIWILGIILTIFVGILSLEGNLSSSVDGITAKATKAAVTNLIPVVGKILGDSVDTVLGCASILKNAVGIVGVIIVIGICIVPIIQLALLSVTYYLTAALCQPIADTKIIKLLEHMGGTFKILLAILCSVAVMIIIGITLVIKISNSGLMYR